MRITKIATKKGDGGTTHGPGNTRVYKDSCFVRTVGAIDELNACIGVARSHVNISPVDVFLETVQNRLLDIGGELYMPQAEALNKADLKLLDTVISNNEVKLENFVLPTGPSWIADLHMARAVCRRAESEVVCYSQLPSVDVRPIVLQYLNRLSDVLFALAVTYSFPKYWDQEKKYD